jgi:hypothetical protein
VAVSIALGSPHVGIAQEASVAEEKPAAKEDAEEAKEEKDQEKSVDDKARKKEDATDEKSAKGESAKEEKKQEAEKSSDAKADEDSKKEDTKPTAEKTGKDESKTPTEASKKSADTAKREKVRLALLTLKDALPETAGQVGPFAETQLDLREVVSRLEKASKDKSIAGVVLDIQNPSIGRGKVEELRGAISIRSSSESWESRRTSSTSENTKAQPSR